MGQCVVLPVMMTHYTAGDAGELGFVMNGSGRQYREKFYMLALPLAVSKIHNRQLKIVENSEANAGLRKPHMCPNICFGLRLSYTFF